MSDALVDAFKNGTDAASAFADSVSDMLETLAEQMVYSVTLAPIMEEAQSAMLDVMKDTSLTDKQKYVQWTNILNGLVSDATEQQQIANSLYEAYQQAAKEQAGDNDGQDDNDTSHRGHSFLFHAVRVDGLVTLRLAHVVAFHPTDEVLAEPHGNRQRQHQRQQRTERNISPQVGAGNPVFA